MVIVGTGTESVLIGIGTRHKTSLLSRYLDLLLNQTQLNSTKMTTNTETAILYDWYW